MLGQTVESEGTLKMLGEEREYLDSLLKTLVEKDAQVKNMAPMDITQYVSELHFLSDKMSDFMHKIDKRIGANKQQVTNELLSSGQKVTASLVHAIVEASETEMKADKDWADRAIKLLSSMRISALSARKMLD